MFQMMYENGRKQHVGREDMTAPFAACPSGQGPNYSTGEDTIWLTYTNVLKESATYICRIDTNCIPEYSNFHNNC
jgi:hypothetical protein